MKDYRPVVSFDHHSNMIVVALGLEALLPSKNSGLENQCNQRNRSILEQCRRLHSMKQPLNITDGLGVVVGEGSSFNQRILFSKY